MIGNWSDQTSEYQPYLIYVEELGQYVFPPGQHVIPNAIANFADDATADEEDALVEAFSFLRTNRTAIAFDEDGALLLDNAELLQVIEGFRSSTEAFLSAEPLSDATESETIDEAEPFAKRLGFVDQLPDEVVNSEFSKDGRRPTIELSKVLEANPNLIARDAVFTVVIDTGIVPAHQRFLDRGGKTRVVVSWEQFGISDEKDRSLPFGKELTRSEIQADVDRIKSGTFSEEQVLRNRGLIGEPEAPVGVGMMRHSSHGMHSADLAAGYSSGSAPDAMNRPLIFVNLPPRRAIGRTGVFLPEFVISAMNRALHWVDSLWKARPNPSSEDEQWPVVINLSFGQQAGPKDGHEELEQMIAEVIRAREAKGNPAPTIVLPAGNNNLERSHVDFALPSADPEDIRVHVQPEDQTASMIELWTQALAGSDWPVDFGITAPNMAFTLAPALTGSARQYADITVDGKRVGMVFARRHERDSGFRFQYVFILNPTQFPDGVPAGKNAALTPHGAWHIRLLNKTGQPIQITGDIEVDQALRSDNRTVRRAYFADPINGALTDKVGRALDLGDIRQPDIDAQRAQVKQAGGQNALANSSLIKIIAGHRRSDGLPVPYSTVMKGADETGSPREMDGSFPCEDAPAHFGTLAAGIGSCATSLRGGTSFAAALATRALVGNGGMLPASGAELRYQDIDAGRIKVRSKVPDAKMGPKGRSDREARQPVDRLASGFVP